MLSLKCVYGRPQSRVCLSFVFFVNFKNEESQNTTKIQLFF